MAKREAMQMAYEDALKVLKKSFGSAFDTRGLATDCYDAIPTGYDDLDSIATNGAKGIYLGGIVELFGPEGSGKTSIAMRIVAEAQKSGLHCVWVDAEAGFSPDLAEINGINLNELIMPDLADIKRKDEKSAIPHAGEILNLVYETITTGAFGLVVLDSVAGLSPPRVLSSDYDPNKMGMGEIGRIFSEQLSKIHHVCASNRCTLVLINQLRMKPGDMWNPEDTPGGRAIKFFADQRIRVDRIGGEKGRVMMVEQDQGSGEEVEKMVGHYARLKLIKNKKSAPSEAVQVPIYYIRYNPDNAKKCFDLARSLQVITVRSGVYTWKEGNGIVAKQESEPEILEAIRVNKWEARLAFDCVAAEMDEKNKSKSEPVKVPSSIRELAGTYNEEQPTSESLPSNEDDKKAKKKTKKSVDLDV